MKNVEQSVSLHPYFKVHSGQMDAVKALLREFVARTTTEPGALYYEFTISGDTVFCREAYVNADGALAHLKNVGDLLQKMVTLADVMRLEVHGPGAELAKLRGPMAAYNPAWFAYECGMRR